MDLSYNMEREFFFFQNNIKNLDLSNKTGRSHLITEFFTSDLDIFDLSRNGKNPVLHVYQNKNGRHIRISFRLRL